MRSGAPQPGSRTFGLFLLMRGSGAMATLMLSVALGYQMYQLTDSAASLGLIGLAQFLPALLLTLPAGHAIDRYQRRTILRCSMGVDVLNISILLTTNLIGHGSVGMLYASAVLTGITRAFNMPAYQALLSSLVPRSQLGRSVALTATTFQTSVLLGPALGGFLYGFNPAIAFGSCLACALMGLSVAFALPVSMQRLSVEPPSLRSVFAGIAYIWRRQEILGAMSLDLFGVLLGGATALLPIFARDILHVGPAGFGIMRAAPAVGGLIVAGLLSRRPFQRHCGRIVFLAVTGFGLATCGFGLSTHFLLSLAMLVLVGATDMVSTNIRQTMIQLRTPDEMRGRVSSVNSIFIGTSNQLGQFESGITAYYFGAVPSVLIGGVGTLVVVALWLGLFPVLRGIDRLDEVPHPTRPLPISI